MSWTASWCVTQQPQVPGTYRKPRMGGSGPTFTLGRERAEVRSQGRPLRLWVGEVGPESKRNLGILCPGPSSTGTPGVWASSPFYQDSEGHFPVFSLPVPPPVFFFLA